MADRLQALASWHAANLLQFLAFHYAFSSEWSNGEHPEQSKEGKARHKKLSDQARMMAYLFVVNFDAWNLFARK